MRIFSKLTILFLTLAIIPMVLVANLFLYSAEKELTKEIHGRLSAVSSFKKNRLETFFHSRKEDLKAVQGFVDVRINLPTLQQFGKDRYNFAYLKAEGRLHDQLWAFINSYRYADLLLLDAKGKLVFMADHNHFSMKPDKILFDASELAKAQNDVFISDPIASGNEDHPYVAYLVGAAKDIRGKFNGYIVLVVDMNVVYEFIKDNTGEGVTSETYLVKEQSNKKFMFISPLSHDPQAILKKEMSAIAWNTISESVDYRGEKVLSVGQLLPGLGWGLITKIDKHEALLSVISMRVLFISIFIFVLLMIILSSFVFAKSIAKPIYKLQQGARIIGQGDLEHKVGIPSKDEIGQLSRSFDEMVDNLKKTMASRDVLEKEIIKRQEAEGQLLALSQELRAMSTHDPLTGVLNRRGLSDVLASTVTMSQRIDLSVQVLLLDLDNFKGINDGHGHAAGDEILVTVAEKISQTVRQSDHVARVGGDEFMVLLLDSREAEAVMVAEKIRMAIAQAFVTVPSGEFIKTTCSIGIVPLGDRPISIDGLLQKLHFSLHVSKGEGKNRIAYQGREGKIDLKRPDAFIEFKKVLMGGEKFYTASQPIFDLRKRTKIGYELLSRLDYEGNNSPDAFLLFARNMDLLGIVDYACLKSCLRSLKGSLVSKQVHINIFPSTLAEVPVERLLQDLTAAGKDMRFCLEINEQQILGDPLYLIPSVSCLKKAGVMIALDDYGFGRSSVETLILLEPDIVKIDKKIIKDIAKDERKRNSLKRLLRVIESCKATVIAEGIETEEDLQLLIELGVSAGQGFLLARPQTPPDFS